MASSSSTCFLRRPPPPTVAIPRPPPLPSCRTGATPLFSCSWPPPPKHARRRRCVTAASSLHLGPDQLAELARNKVLVAAAAASAIGQLSKPFTSGAGGRRLDLRNVFRSGGMPSTHSASVVAVATSLGLERGFADSIFGMSVVFAAIVMYDAQGVRREVGSHAKVLNKFSVLRGKVLLDSELDMAAELVSVPGEATSSSYSNTNRSQRHSSRDGSPRPSLLRSSDCSDSEPEVTESAQLKQAYIEEYRLSESVGHTELQVAVGALLGFVVALAVYATL